ncbi:MAG: hypothetical protein IPM55_24045 [Acidobacteria bacterium]|nr:hypothetical protein [Acidobacteriota bacterium]
MAELMLVRPEDQRFMDIAGGGLRYLVFDELHTYRGRQGADVAMLIRRIKEKCAAPDIIHIGTSATMVADRQVGPDKRRAMVADFASKLFGHAFNADQVIEESLVTFTEGGLPSREELHAALGNPLSTTTDEFKRHPLARWAEIEFGVEPEEGGRLKRRVPRTLAAAAKLLSDTSGVEAKVCELRLRELISLAGTLNRQTRGRAFAFKLHQFIGQGRALYATLEPVDRREFSMEGQVRASGGRLYAPVKFCRQCGQDYYHVLRGDSRFIPHPVESSEDDQEPSGLSDAAPLVNDWSDDQIPLNGETGNGKLRKTWRDRVPVAVLVSPDGSYGSQQRDGTIKMWWQAVPFSLCLNCGEFHTAQEREFGKLASISSEARSSATTILATSLQEMPERRAGVTNC